MSLKRLLFVGFLVVSSPALAQQATIIQPAGSGSVSCGPGITGCPSGPLSPTQALGNSGAAITGTTYTVDLTSNITTSDLARELVFTGSSASAWTLGTGSNGMGFDVVNRGTANITITATGNINGNSTLVIPPGLSANIFFGNSTWNAFNIPIASSTQFGAMKPDNSTITCTGGVCTSTAGGSVNGYAANRYYLVSPAPTQIGGTMTADTIYWFNAAITAQVTISQLGADVQTLFSGGKFQLAMYACGSDQNPTGSPLAVTGDISTTTIGMKYGDVNSSVPYSVTSPGVYCFGVNTDNTTAKFITLSSTSVPNALAGTASSTAILGAGQITVKSTSQTYGTWPANPSVSETLQAPSNGTTVAQVMKISAVP